MAHPLEHDIAQVLIRALPPDDVMPWPVLVANDGSGHIVPHLRAISGQGITWNRRANGEAMPTPWPPPGPFAAAIVRLPTARAELVMTLHATASSVSPGGLIWLYGANDEGIKSAVKPLEALLGAVTVVATRGHCRVLSARRPPRAELAGLKSQLADWRTSITIEANRFAHNARGAARTFATYPGLFADGRLDVGTRLLLAHLPTLRAGAAVLDFGCGIGVIAAAVRARASGVQLTLVDNDALALHAARENVAEATFAMSLAGIATASLDAIVSNPPIHAGKVEDHTALAALISVGPRLLKRGGLLQIVVQRRVGAPELIRQSFGSCVIVAEDGVFQVLRGVRG